MLERRVEVLRRLGATAATVIAGGLLLRFPLELASTPGWPAADEHQAALAEWSRRLAEALVDVPEATVLGFLPQGAPVGPADPITAAEAFDQATREEFERIRAALAPRRIVASVEAEVVLAHVGALVTLSKTPGFEGLQGLEPIGTGWVLVERGAH